MYLNYVVVNSVSLRGVLKMVKKTKKTMDKEFRKKAIASAKARLPSSRSKVKCVGCFAPRNTLTVKTHVESEWNKDQIEIDATKSGVNLPCGYCSEIRYLNMSKFSLDVFKVDFDKFDKFILLKDDKFNALIGIATQGKSLDLGEFHTDI